MLTWNLPRAASFARCCRRSAAAINAAGQPSFDAFCVWLEVQGPRIESVNAPQVGRIAFQRSISMTACCDSPCRPRRYFPACFPRGDASWHSVNSRLHSEGRDIVSHCARGRRSRFHPFSRRGWQERNQDSRRTLADGICSIPLSAVAELPSAIKFSPESSTV